MNDRRKQLKHEARKGGGCAWDGTAEPRTPGQAEVVHSSSWSLPEPGLSPSLCPHHPAPELL